MPLREIGTEREPYAGFPPSICVTLRLSSQTISYAKDTIHNYIFLLFYDAENNYSVQYGLKEIFR